MPVSARGREQANGYVHPLAGAVLVTVACPACGTANTEIVRPGSLTITGCQKCGHAR